MFQFGSGNLYGTISGANPTPRKFAQLQDINFDFSFSMKSMFGQSQLAVDMRRGEQKITGKAKFGKIDGNALNDLFFSQTATTGLVLTAIGESGAIPASTPWTVTVVNSATWTQDLGVVYASTGVAFTRVASSPTAGQYTVAAGVYTFSTGDAGVNVYIDYLYTAATGGTKISLSNQSMGITPTFQGVFTGSTGGKTVTLILNACTSSKLAIATKLEDYSYPELDIEVMADSGNNIGTLSVSS